VPRHVTRLVTRLVVDYFTYATRPVASARRAACRVTHRRLLRLAQARRRLLRLRRAFGCLGTLRGSSSTTSTTPCIRVPRHVTRLITRLVAPLVIDYFAYATRPGASARRVAHLAARHRLLRLHRASGCLGTSRGSSCGSSSTTSTTPRVQVTQHVARLVTRLVAPLVADYFAYVARPGASARHAARHPTRRQLLHLRRASGFFGTSRGLSCDASSTTSPRTGSSSTTSPHAGSSSTTSPTPRVWVPRHVARLVTRLVVDYFTYVASPVASARRAACRVTHRRQLRLAQARR
jgi:hypothetical protein